MSLADKAFVSDTCNNYV